MVFSIFSEFPIFLQISPDANILIPAKICGNCLNWLEACTKLKSLVVDSDERILALKRSLDIKIEPSIDSAALEFKKEELQEIFNNISSSSLSEAFEEKVDLSKIKLPEPMLDEYISFTEALANWETTVEVFEPKREPISEDSSSSDESQNEEPAPKIVACSVLLKRLSSQAVEKKKTRSRYRCNYCKKEFTKNEIVGHVSSHMGPHKMRFCSECGKTFAWSQSKQLDSHVRAEHPRCFRFKCEECGKTFKTQRGLLIHKSSHGRRNL